MKDQFIKENVNVNRQINQTEITSLDKALFAGNIDSVLKSVASLKEQYGDNVSIKHVFFASQDAFSSGSDKYVLVKSVPETDKEYQTRIDKEQKLAVKLFDEKVKAVVEKVLNNKKLTKEEKSFVSYLNEKSKESFCV